MAKRRYSGKWIRAHSRVAQWKDREGKRIDALKPQPPPEEREPNIPRHLSPLLQGIREEAAAQQAAWERREGQMPPRKRSPQRTNARVTPAT